MTRLVSLSGVVIDAMPEAVPRLLAGGTFALCDGEAMPQPEPDPAPQAEPAPGEGAALDRGAFGGTGEGGGDDLLSMSAAELRALAESLGVKVPAKASKARMAEAIEAARG